jgi:hypothetical protein
VGPFGLGRPELLAPPVDVHRRPPDLGGAGGQVQVLARQADDFGHAPPLQEQQCDSGAQAVVLSHGEEGGQLVAFERHTSTASSGTWP